MVAPAAEKAKGMIDLHYAPTPNGWKISIMLEELRLPYKVIPVDIRAGEQFRPEFLAISPNNRIPAIIDHEPAFNVYMDEVNDWGIKALERAAEGLTCSTAVQICYGYGIKANTDWKETLGSQWRQY